MCGMMLFVHLLLELDRPFASDLEEALWQHQLRTWMRVRELKHEVQIRNVLR